MSIEQKLIDAVQAEPVLYDKNTRGYTDTEVKDITWKRIGDELGLDDKQCQKKWKTLRDCYVRDLNHKSTKKPWKYFKKMDFLKDHVSSKITTSQLEAIEFIVNGQMDTSIDEPSSSSTRYDESLEPPLTRSGSLESLLTALKESANVPSSSSHKFGDTVITPAVVKQQKARTRKDSSDSDDLESLSRFYQQLIEIVRPDERNEVDLFFEQIGKIVKSSNLTNIQFLDLQSKLTMYVKIQLQTYKDK